MSRVRLLAGDKARLLRARMDISVLPNNNHPEKFLQLDVRMLPASCGVTQVGALLVSQRHWQNRVYVQVGLVSVSLAVAPRLPLAWDLDHGVCSDPPWQEKLLQLLRMCCCGSRALSPSPPEREKTQDGEERPGSSRDPCCPVRGPVPGEAHQPSHSHLQR